MKPFLEVNWNNLLVVNYRVDPMELGLLEAQLPTGTVLDDFHGEHYVSVVGFEFQKTRILGVPMPFYRDFAEINLRFYVRRKVDGSWRRGVVFLKEIVPCRLPALIANKVFKENFHIHLDIARVYGPQWAAALGHKPVSVFYADGSHVGVTKPQMITNPMKQ